MGDKVKISKHSGRLALSMIGTAPITWCKDPIDIYFSMSEASEAFSEDEVRLGGDHPDTLLCLIASIGGAKKPYKSLGSVNEPPAPLAVKRTDMMADDELRALADGSENCECLFGHMKSFGGADWIDIAGEGSRIAGVMMRENITDEPIDLLIFAVAAEAARSAYNCVAEALGVDAEALDLCMGRWEERDFSDGLPIAVGSEKLLQMIAEYKQWLDDRPLREIDAPTVAVEPSK